MGWNSAGVSAIVIDTSALLDAAARAAVVRLSAASRLELALVAESARHGIEATEVEQLLLALRVEVMPFDQHQLHWALEGWRRYGKGRPPAVQGRRLRGHRRCPPALES